MYLDRVQNIINTKLSFLTLLLFIVFSSNASNQLETIKIGEDIRKYRLFVPSTYQSTNAYPLVLNFHGTNNTPEFQEALSEFEKLAEIEGFIVITPSALYKRPQDGRITWNVNFKAGPDDILFIRELIDQLKKQYNINENKIFASGFSGGARMSSRLACELSNTIAAIAPVAGVRFPKDCKPSRAVPVITFHGEADNINHFELSNDSPDYWMMGVEDALSGWVENNQCKSTTMNKYSSSLRVIKYKKCSNNADIVFYRSSKAGHTWPGSQKAKTFAKYGLGKTEEQLKATTLIWEFFKRHPKP